MSRRVAVLCPHLAGGQHGGVERVARWLHDALLEHPAWEPRLVSLAVSRRDAASVRVLDPRSWRAGPGVVEGDLDGVPVRHVGAWAVEAEPMRYRPRRALDAVLREADLVQVVSGTPAYGLAASRAGRPLCLQVATTVASERRHEGARSLGRVRRAVDAAVARSEDAALAAADHVMVENAWMRDEVRRRADVPVTLAPPGVDDDRFSPDPDPGPGEHLLTVCRLSSERKNLPGLLRSYAAAGRDVLPLVLAGAGPVPEPLRALVRELRADVRWVVDPTDDELVGLYRAARALVLPSHEEGLGLAYVEALACGAPLVATRTAGAQEVFARGAPGTLVDCFTGTSEALAAAIREHSRTPLTPADRAAARGVAVAEFGRSASLRRFTAVWERLT